MKISANDTASVLATITNATEIQRIADAVGFDPTQPGLAQECLADTQAAFYLPPAIPQQARPTAQIYVALGLFVYSKYMDEGLEPTREIYDWYCENTANTNLIEYLEAEDDGEIDPRWDEAACLQQQPA
jgi:hypothetical protein